MSRWPFMLIILLAGACWPLQAAVNSELKTRTGKPLVAAMVNGGGAAIFAGLLLLTLGFILGGKPSPSSEPASVPWWAWGGGFFSVLVIVAQSSSARPLGAGLLVVLFMTGQVTSSFIFDGLGLLGYDKKPIGLPRVAGALLVIAGAILMTLDQRPSR